MLKSITSMFNSNANSNSKKNKNTGETKNGNVSVRSPDEIENLEQIIHTGPVVFVLVHADWCGHCQTYKPLWKELEETPGRTANMAMIHHDMVEQSPTLKEAEVPGYPSVLKVYPNGKIEKFSGTNAMPNIRNKDEMLREIITPSLGNSPASMKTKRNLSNTAIKSSNNLKASANSITIGASEAPMLPPMKGGSLYAALAQALQQAGPSAVLLAASSALPPKRSSSSVRRTRKARSKRTSRAKSRKN